MPYRFIRMMSRATVTTSEIVDDIVAYCGLPLPARLLVNILLIAKAIVPGRRRINAGRTCVIFFENTSGKINHAAAASPIALKTELTSVMNVI